MSKVCIVINFNSRSSGFEEYFLQLKNRFRFHVSIIENSEGDFGLFLATNNIPYTVLKPLPKYLFFIQVLRLIFIFLRQKPKLVHCHLFEASLYGLTAAKICGIKNRIHTRHHSTLHHDYFPSAVKYDKWINNLSTKIVSISPVVTNILTKQEGVDKNKIVEIPHAFNVSSFDSVEPNSVLHMKQKYAIKETAIVVGVVSRYIDWKGVQFIIPAFKTLLSQYPETVLILANAKGPYERELKEMLSTLPDKCYREIIFERDLFTLFKCFDVFVHCPVNDKAEAFGQVYIEAILAEVPCVFTVSGEAHHLFDRKEGIEWVQHNNANAIASALSKIINNYTQYKIEIEKTKIAIQNRYSPALQAEKLMKLYNA
jgi:glycosyltransferase involved in cell wall biosynthesis